MGYDTTFQGQFDVTPALRPEHVDYLRAFSETRRMTWDERAKTLPDPIREMVGLPFGVDGAYFVSQDESLVLVNYCPPFEQPSLWCQWVPTDDGTAIEWDGVEKFYDYVAWLEYLIEHFFAPWGYVLNGVVDYQGEEISDHGSIVVENNVVVKKW